MKEKIKNLYNSVFTYEKQRQEQPDNFSKFAFRKHKSLHLYGIISYIVLAVLTGVAIYEIVQCKHRHEGADLFYVELILFAVMLAISQIFNQTRMIIALTITALLVTIDQIENGISHWIIYMVLVLDGLFAYYLASHIRHIDTYMKDND